MPRQLFADLTAPNKPGGRCNNGHFFVVAKSLRADQQKINGFVYLGFTLGEYLGGGWKDRNLYRSQEGFSMCVTNWEHLAGAELLSPAGPSGWPAATGKSSSKR